jgi:hypothetical protein
MAKGMRERIRSAPWWAKGALKLTISKLPVGYPILRSLSLTRHGGMERPAWAYETFHKHYDTAEFHRRTGGFTLLEIGPGDSLFTALIAKAHGASRIHLVDVGRFANSDLALYRAMASFLKERGLSVPDISSARNIDDVLAACNATYSTDGLEAMKRLSDHSIDFIFSNSVLQHVWRDQFTEMAGTLRRVLDPQGCCVHSIDFRDMLGKSLNHLRFSESVWESKSFRQSGFYTNRLRLSEMRQAFVAAGFDVELVEVNRWPDVPLRRRSMSLPYREMPDDELRVATVRLILRPARPESRSDTVS